MGFDLSDEDFDYHDHFKEFDDDFFKKGHHKPGPSFGTMELIITITSVVGIIIVLILLCKCCQRNKHRGQVIMPPPPPGPVTTAPYPQQQYITPAVPVVQAYPAPYPTPFPHPAPYPHPTHGVQAGAGMPMPAGGAAPYPAGYPHPQPHPQVAAPSAPDANALPPSYEQATSTDFKHSTPYNPGYN